MAAVGKPGVELRKFRLNQAQKTGADIMSLYCPACQSIFAPEVPDLPFRVESILALLGRSLGIVHEDRLQRYQAYHDAERVLREAEGCLRGSNLPQETLRAFCARFFR
jgi:hypothetical protein